MIVIFFFRNHCGFVLLISLSVVFLEMKVEWCSQIIMPANGLVWVTFFFFSLPANNT